MATDLGTAKGYRQRTRARAFCSRLQSMLRSIFAQAVARLFLSVAALALAVFGAAGTADYWQAWLYLGIFFVGSLTVTAYFSIHDPELIRRRNAFGAGAERSPGQGIIATAIQLSVLLCLAVPGLDHRFGWSHVPTGVVLLAELGHLIAFGILFWVFRHNSFAAATLTVEDNHRVIDTGPYAIVRHPMYAGGLLLMLGTPPALGSFYGLVAVAPVLVALIARLVTEERCLVAQLPGYAAYRTRVRYRLLPGVF